MSVAAPDSTVIFGPHTGASPYSVQYSCDRALAPHYTPFGSETLMTRGRDG